tara:strand:- start:995 stop:1249 length:255 start_codon:yes stop_codon:yes gene_type:complete
MEQKEIIQIIKDLRDCPKESTSKWHVDICANKLIDKLETEQLTLTDVSQRSELLKAYAELLQRDYTNHFFDDKVEESIDQFLSL